MHKTFSPGHGRLPTCLWGNLFRIDAVELDRACAGWHVGTTSKPGHLEEDIGLQTRTHLLALVLHVGAMPCRVLHRDTRASDSIPNTNGIHAHLLSRGGFGGFQGEAVVIFAVRDKYNVLIGVGQGAEGTERLADRIANQGATAGHGVRPYLVELLEKEAIIQSQRTLQARLASKCYETKTVPRLFLEHLQ